MLEVTTNNHPRDLYCYAEAVGMGASPAEFDYIEEEEEHYTPRLFRYRGCWYDTHEFTRIVPPGCKAVGFEHHDIDGSLAGWDGIQTDSYFSAIVVRWADNFERVIAGLALSR